MKKLVSAFALAVILTACSPKESKDGNSITAKSPNIVFLFTDDQTYTALGALGNDEIFTPNMDRIVASGTSFTHAYNMGGWNGAICAASRAMMISGRYIWEANQFRQKWIDRDSMALTQTWPKIMEAAGYDTYMTGKWHVDAPADQIFQRAQHIRPGMPRDNWNHNEMVRRFKEEVHTGKISAAELMPVGYNRPLNEDDATWSPTDTAFGGFWEGGQHWSEVLRDDALGYIEDAQQSDRPFFMYLAFNAPHDPRQAPQKYIDMYPLDQISLPASYQPLYPYKDSIGNDPSLRDEALAPFPRTPYAVKKHIQEYYAIITHLDNQIGIILDELESTGQLENTYIFLSADHGLSVGRHGLIGKQSMYDHSVRVPLVISGPGIPKNKSVGHDIYLQDIMATSLELADIPKPDYVAFDSFLDMAKGNDEEHYNKIYGAYVDLQRMVRKDGFKLIYYPKIEKLRLYNIESDPDEINDLAAEVQYSGRIQTLWDELVLHATSIDDPLTFPDLNTLL